MTVWVHVRILLEVALDIGDAIPYSERSVPCMGYVEVEAIWWPKCVFPLALNRRFAVQILVRLEYKLVVVKPHAIATVFVSESILQSVNLA